MSQKSKILCLYSGGLDSAGMLWQIINDLKYSEYDILIHHVHMINVTNRYNAEKLAIDKTLPLFKKYAKQNLYYSSSVMDFTFLGKAVPIDADVYGFVAANLVNIDLNISAIAIGRTLDDKNSGGDSLIQLVDCIERALFLVNYTRPNYSSAKCITPVVELTKKQIWNMLPSEIREQTWSCRTPLYSKHSDGSLIATPCNKCHSCAARTNLR